MVRAWPPLRSAQMGEVASRTDSGSMEHLESRAVTRKPLTPVAELASSRREMVLPRSKSILLKTGEKESTTEEEAPRTNRGGLVLSQVGVMVEMSTSVGAL